MDHSSELSKFVATNLATSVSSDVGARLIKLLWGSGLYQDGGGSRNQADPATPALPPVPKRDRVGIWERSEGGTFSRSRPMANEWNMWANRGQIKAKSTRTRVVLIGESVARGYLYDPLFTPTGVLDGLLKSHLGAGAVEVIDLARLNLQRAALQDLAISALSLEPDSLIIFAGNNWGAGCLSDLIEGEHLPSLYPLVGSKGVAGLKELAESRLKSQVEDTVNHISSVYRSHGIPTLWLIPEFNLRDWRDPVTNPPYLRGAANEEWMRLHRSASDALRSAQFGLAAEAAQRMLALDGGICVATLYLLADCSAALGDSNAELEYLKRARDSLIWDDSGCIPSRSYTVVQNSLREAVRAQGSEVVDLPHIFNAYLDGQLPDRRLFVDHCHLTSLGVCLSMAGAAAPLLKILMGQTHSWRDLMRDASRMKPSPEVEAEASFLAAVHNAHWWQSAEVVDHFIQLALRGSTHIARVAETFTEVQTRRAPMLLGESLSRSPSNSGLTQFYTVQYTKQLLDEVLLPAVNRLMNSPAASDHRIDTLQQQEHSVTKRPTDLLDFYYCSAARQPKELMWAYSTQSRDSSLRKRPDYYQAYENISRFVFVGEQLHAVKLALTCRLPRGAGIKEHVIKIGVNGHEISSVCASQQWRTWEFEIVGERIRDGLNRVTIEWPSPQFSADTSLKALFAALNSSQKMPEFYPTFGEVHRFVAYCGCAEHLDGVASV
jgi:hypothetical protein